MLKPLLVLSHGTQTCARDSNNYVRETIVDLSDSHACPFFSVAVGKS